MYSKTTLVVIGLTVLFGVNAAPQTANKCSGQSCYVALLSASTPDAYTMQGKAKPRGGNAMGDSCIKSHYKTLGLPPPAGLKYVLDDDYLNAAAQPNNFLALEKEANDALKRRSIEEAEKAMIESITGSSEFQDAEQVEEIEGTANATSLEKRQGACKPYTLLFGRGTTEMGTMGATVGPSLSAAMGGGQWSVEGINYSADLSGIYCLGMTGGMKCVKQLEAVFAKCPNTKIVTSGYSQGAMVARECVAWASEKVRANVKAIATFGDPFNGAKVKGMPVERVKAWCNVGDGVCNGDFSIGAAHLSYGTSVSAAAAWIKQQVAK